MSTQRNTPVIITSVFGCWQCGQIKDSAHLDECPTYRNARANAAARQASKPVTQSPSSLAALQQRVTMNTLQARVATMMDRNAEAVYARCVHHMGKQVAAHDKTVETMIVALHTQAQLADSASKLSGAERMIRSGSY